MSFLKELNHLEVEILLKCNGIWETNMHRLLLNPSHRAQTRCISRGRARSAAGMCQGNLLEVDSFKLKPLSTHKHHCICIGYLSVIPFCAAIFKVPSFTYFLKFLIKVAQIKEKQKSMCLGGIK